MGVSELVTEVAFGGETRTFAYLLAPTAMAFVVVEALTYGASKQNDEAPNGGTRGFFGSSSERSDGREAVTWLAI